MTLKYDLHCHSTVSDGLLTPSALVTHAAQQGVNVLALTDHDDLGGLAEARAQAKSLGIRFINGVEISATWRKRTLHIVGLNIDPQNAALNQAFASVREARFNRATLMAADLARVGIHGALEGAQKVAGNSIITRIHFARFLVENKHAKDTKTVFKKFLVKGKPGYAAHEWMPLAEAVTLILNSGGTAVLAHPGRYELGRTTMLELLEEFRALGGTAIEVVTGSHTPAHYVEYAKYAHMFGFKASVGSDYHGQGISFMEMGRLPDLPSQCVPIWQDWHEKQDGKVV